MTGTKRNTRKFRRTRHSSTMFLRNKEELRRTYENREEGTKLDCWHIEVLVFPSIPRMFAYFITKKHSVFKRLRVDGLTWEGIP
jgi:hypothetical protein